jgi:hypothetical protein
VSTEHREHAMGQDLLEQGTERGSRAGGWGRSAALVASGLLAGAVIAGTVVAGAASDDGRDGVWAGQDGGRHGDGHHHGEEPLTGTTAHRVTEAALAEYPGATVRRVETDSDGVYEAHLETDDGTRVTVEVGEDFRVTGMEEHR